MPARPASAPTAFWAQDGVYDAFTKRLAETVGAMNVADAVQESAKIVAGRQARRPWRAWGRPVPCPSPDTVCSITPRAKPHTWPEAIR